MHDTETPASDPQRTDPEFAESQAGIQRSGTGHGSAPHAAAPGLPDAPEPSSERPVDQAGPIGHDGAQRPPTDRTADPATWEMEAQGDVSRPVDDRNDQHDAEQHDPRVSTVSLDTEDGGTVVISQQNAGPGQQVGSGEFKEPGTATRQKSTEAAAAGQDHLEAHAPVDGDDAGPSQ